MSGNGDVVIFAILGSLGGVIAFIGATWVVVRAIFTQSSVTKDNTEAVKELNDTVKGLAGELHSQGERIARLEGRGWEGRAFTPRQH